MNPILINRIESLLTAPKPHRESGDTLDEWIKLHARFDQRLEELRDCYFSITGKMLVPPIG